MPGFAPPGLATPALATPGAPMPAPTTVPPRLIVPLLIAALVSLTLGLFARFHVASGIAVDVGGFSSAQSAKAWLTSVAAVLAVGQLISALIIYGKIRVKAPSWIGAFHRWSGRVAFFATIPVAMHCLFAFGFEDYSIRVLIHSLLGCLFYGVFTLKMLVLTKRGLAGWVLPLVGGLVFTVLIAIWSTSALWFFSVRGLIF